MLIKTGSWFSPIPRDHVRVSISRYVPRGMPAGYKLFRVLAPGPWFNTTGPTEYLLRYNAEVLAKLDPAGVVEEVKNLAAGHVPVLCCFESTASIAAGEHWCHRHMVAQWIEDRLGIQVAEVDAPPGFDRWGAWRRLGVGPPAYT